MFYSCLNRRRRFSNKIRRYLAVTLVFVLFTTIFYNPGIVKAEGSTVTWTGLAGDGLWNTSGNWDVGQIPVSGDCVIIPADAAVEYTTSDISITLQCTGELTVSGGSLSLVGNSSFSGSILNVSGDISISRPGSTFTWTDGNIQGNGNFTIETDTQLIIDTNTVKSINCSLTNNGEVKVNKGTLKLSGGSQGSGDFTLLGGTLLEFGGQTYSVDGNMVDAGNSASFIVSNSSTVIFNGLYNIRNTSVNNGTSATWNGNTSIGALNNFGDTVFNSDTILSTLYFLSGTIGGSGSITFDGTGNFRWQGGTIGGTGLLTIGPDGVLDLIGDGEKILNRSLINTGTVKISRGTVKISEPVTNQGELSISKDCASVTMYKGYNQTEQGTLSFDIGGDTVFKNLHVAQTLSLAGELYVNLINDYVPVVGTSFEVLTYVVQPESSFFSIGSSTESIIFEPTYNDNNLTLTAATTTPSDTTPPSVINYTPTSGATNVPVDTNALVLQFNEQVWGENNKSIGIYDNTDWLACAVYANSQDSQWVEGNGTNTIKLNLPSAFKFKHNKSYYIKIDAGAFKDESGNEYEGIDDSTSWTFTIEPDTTQPEWADTYPKIVDITQTGFKLLVKTNELSTAYYVILDDGAEAPSAEQVISGQDSTGTQLEEGLQGFDGLFADSESSIDIIGLNPNTDYDIYVVAQDDSGNLQSEPVKLEVTTVLPASSDAEIITYSLEEQTDVATIDSVNRTINIEVAQGTNVTNLVAKFTLSTGASAMVNVVPQVSGTTSVDFTNPVTYVVTAEDGTTTKNWTVIVTVKDPQPTDDQLWNYRSPLPTQNHLNDIKYINGKFIALGWKGTLIASTDGVGWKTIDLGTVDTLTGIAYGNGKYVVVGATNSYNGKVYTSDDGKNWSQSAETQNFALYDVVYGNNKFVAVGQSGKVAISSDGVSWEIKPSSVIQHNLSSIIFANGTYVAVGSNGSIVTSTDGETWTARGAISYDLWDITYGDGMLVAVGGDYGQYESPRIYTSIDSGVTWTQRSLPSAYARLMTVEYDGNRFIAVGNTSTGNAYVLTSTDGASWINQNVQINVILNAITSGIGKYVAVGAVGNIFTSVDGASWTCRTLGTNKRLMDVTYNGNIFVSVGEKGTIQTSPDGITWSIQNSGTTEHLRAIDYLNNQFIAVGDKGVLLTSDDSVTWVSQTSGITRELLDVAYGNDIYVAVGGSNYAAIILTSTDSITWTSVNHGYSIPFVSIAYGNGTFVALGQNGQVYRSTDAVNWPRTYLPGVAYPKDIVFHNGMFMAVGGYGKIYLSSDDGESWTVADIGVDVYLESIAYGDRNITAVGQFGKIVTSFDNGVTWTDQPSGLTINNNLNDDGNLYGIVAGSTNFVVVGYSGVTLQSRDFGNTSINDENAVATDKAALNFDTIKGLNTDENNITSSLNLINSGTNGTTISWSVDPDNSWIDTGSGEVIRPIHDDQSVTLTATITKGVASDTKVFYLIIKRVDMLVSATISPSTTNFDKNPVNQVDVSITIEWNDSTKVVDIKANGISIKEGNYSVSENTLTINKEYLAAQAIGCLVLTVEFDKGEASTLAIDISNTALSSNANMDSLMLSTGTLNPTFEPDTTNYTVSVSYSESSITVTPVTADSKATVKVNNQNVANGQNSQTISLDVGSNTISIVVTAQDGTTKDYIIFVTRASSGGGGNTGGGTKSTSVPTLKATLDAGMYKKDISISIDSTNGIASVILNKDILKKAFSKTETDSDGTMTVSIEIPKVQGAVEYILKLPTEILVSGNANRKIKMVSEVGTFTLPCNMLQGIEFENTKDVGISISKADMSELPPDIIGGRTVVKLILTAGDQIIAWSNPDAPVTVSIPYTYPTEEMPNSEFITVLFIDRTGNIISVPSGRYDLVTGMVTFSTTHFGHYTAAYVTKTFDDLANVAWAKDQIEVLSSKGILKGTSENEYSPCANITRADFLYFLVRTLGIDAWVNENFDDIRQDAYYYKEIGIAKRLGITFGIGNNKFNPEASITRQDMMVLTERTLGMLKKLKQLGTASDLEMFADKSLIADYAMDSVASLVKEGLIVGSSNKVNPQGNTTRAEAAVFMYRIYIKY